MTANIKSLVRGATLALVFIFSFSALAQETRSTLSKLDRPMPLSKLRGRVSSLPPPVPGCYTFRRGEATRWEEVPCLSPEEASRIPHLQEGGAFPGLPGIQTQFEPIIGGGTGGLTPHITGFAAAGLQGGAVEVQLGSNLNETDSALGVTAFSVQLNTNGFSATCQSVAPNPPGLGPQSFSPCITGDEGWVQFTYQTSDFGKSNDAICIWNVDLTKQYYYPPNTWQRCQPVGKAGAWPVGQSIELFGGVDTTSHTLTLLAFLPWLDTVASVVNYDWFSLCWTPGALSAQCSWDQVVGGILGWGNGSNAVFGPGSYIGTTVTAQSSFQPFGGVSVLDSGTSGVSNAPGHYTAYTVETNNLTLYYFVLPTPFCSQSECSVTFNASNVPPP
ncbi:MAG TPA: hypothetical protein VEK34_08040 [Methylocella sp.]|nr:hypothetical protein [Methylocella sp.]